jgi:hypothetical protein
MCSRKYVCEILHSPGPIDPYTPVKGLGALDRGSTCCGAGWICRIWIHRGFIVAG